MNNSHLDDLLLAKYLDGELEAARAMNVREHLDTCEACRNLMAETESVFRAYKSVCRQALPAPPRPWMDLEPHLRKLDAEQRQTAVRSLTPRRTSSWWWAAAAAGVAVAFLFLRLSTDETVSAAELLEKASARDVPVSRVQVTTRKGRFVRAGREIGDPELAAMFREANFDWNEPLRAAAFATWRSNLAEKQDEVRILENPNTRIGRFFRIRTSTPTGSLSEVSIMIRAADLRAVEERFEFRNQEWVEISEAPGEQQQPVTIAQAPSPNRLAERQMSSADELKVYAALHKIGADLGEPIEIRRTDQAIEVTVLGASARREREIREALADLPNTSLTFEQPPAVKSPGEVGRTTEEAPVGPLHSRLLTLMGSAANVENFTNAALEASESALARAHAVRQLSDRFASRDQFDVAERDMLSTIESDHVSALRQSVRRLSEILQPLLGKDELRATGPRVDAHALLGAAQRFDTLLSVALASAGESGDPERVISQMRDALGQLDRASREYSQ